MRKLTEDKIEQLKNLYGKIGIGKLEEQLGVSRYRIYQLVKKYNLKSNPNTRKRLNVDHDFFKEPNLLNSYWAGFIAADGNICKTRNRLRIELSTKDLLHLEDFKNHINFDGEIKFLDKIRSATGSVSKMCYITVHSKNFVDDLRENYNIVPNKTKTLEPPGNLNIDNRMAYIKGYIDGDGCIRYSKHKEFNSKRLTLGFIGTSSLLNWCKENIDNLLNIKDNSEVRKHKSHMYVYHISKNEKIISLCKYMLNLKTPQLDRKWNIANEYIKRYESKYDEIWFKENENNSKGISFRKDTGKWIVRLYKNKKLIYYSSHETKEEAMIVCLNSRKKYEC